MYGRTLLPGLTSIPTELSSMPVWYTELPPLDIPDMKLQRFDGTEWVEIDQEYHDSIFPMYLAAQDAELSGTDLYIFKWVDTRQKIPQSVVDVRKSIRARYKFFFNTFKDDYVEPEKDLVSFSRTFSEVVTSNQSEYQNDILKDANIIHNVKINGEDLQLPAYNATTGVVTGLSVTTGDKITILFN